MQLVYASDVQLPVCSPAQRRVYTARLRQAPRTHNAAAGQLTSGTTGAESGRGVENPAPGSPAGCHGAWGRRGEQHAVAVSRAAMMPYARARDAVVWWAARALCRAAHRDVLADEHT